MHEMALAQGILGVVLDKANGERVRAVRVRVGALQRVVPESLELCFRLAAADTVAADALLHLHATFGDELLVDGVEVASGWRLRPGVSEIRAR
jgi:Zn finger protein HypA/HybF involved in hydrogenase expression